MASSDLEHLIRIHSGFLFKKKKKRAKSRLVGLRFNLAPSQQWSSVNLTPLFLGPLTSTLWCTCQLQGHVHKVLGGYQTQDPWICNQTCYHLHYRAWQHETGLGVFKGTLFLLHLLVY